MQWKWLYVKSDSATPEFRTLVWLFFRKQWYVIYYWEKIHMLAIFKANTRWISSINFKTWNCIFKKKKPVFQNLKENVKLIEGGKKIVFLYPPCFSAWAPANYTAESQINIRKTEFMNTCEAHAGETQGWVTQREFWFI